MTKIEILGMIILGAGISLPALLLLASIGAGVRDRILRRRLG